MRVYNFVVFSTAKIHNSFQSDVIKYKKQCTSALLFQHKPKKEGLLEIASKRP